VPEARAAIVVVIHSDGNACTCCLIWWIREGYQPFIRYGVCATNVTFGNGDLIEDMASLVAIRLPDIGYRLIKALLNVENNIDIGCLVTYQP